jgi:hypothetical protein
MAWTHYGNRGTAQNKTSSATLAITPTATIAVGRLLIIWTAWDSHRGTPYPISATSSIGQTKVTDSQGNIYVQLTSQGAAEDGTHVRAGLFISRIRTQLTTSDTVTITSKTAVDAKSASMHEFGSTLTGWVFNSQGQDSDHVWRTANGDVPDLVLASMVSQSYLLLHLLAVEGPDTDAYTWDGDYTQITGTGTTGGADDENVHIRGSYRIATLTGDTLSITSDTADRDLSQGLFSLAEVDIPSGSKTFPEYGLLDDANRADENPLSFGGMWLKSSGGLGVVPGGIQDADLKVLSNEFKVAHSHIDSYGKYFWQDDIPCAYSEAWATLSANPSASIEGQTPPTPDTNPGVRGIGVGIGKPDGFSGSDLTAAVNLMRLGKFQVDDLLWFRNPSSGGILMAFVGAMAAGMRIGVQQIAGRYYHAYIDQNLGNGWEWLMCIDWGNSPLTRPQRPILWVSGTEAAADNFGGGHRCFGPKIIRRLGG